MPKPKTRVSLAYNPDDNVFNVDKILDKRVRGRRTEYLIKWDGFSDEHNTWEPEKNLSTSLVVEYNRKKESFKQTTKSNELVKKLETKKASGVERGLTAEQIVGCEMNNESVKFIVKWKGEQDEEKVTADQVKQKCPQLLIKFYEKRLQWCDGSRLDEKKNDIYTDDDDDDAEDYEQDDSLFAFENNEQPERIFGCTNQNGELKFVMKWMNKNKADLVRAKIANKRCPHLVIKFYEEIIKWRS